MITYTDFCKSFVFKHSAGNSDAQAVFDFLSKPENIHNMIVFTNLKLPAISGIVQDLENTFSAAPLFPLTNDRNRQIVGRMVKFILEHFGYAPSVGGPRSRTALRNFSEAKLFKTASVYDLVNPPIHTILMQIV